MTHSLLLVGQPFDLSILQTQLNYLMDTCIREIIAIFPGVYIVVFNSVPPLLSSFYYNLKIDDARIVLPCGCYTACFAEKGTTILHRTVALDNKRTLHSQYYFIQKDCPIILSL
jgi:hypothetical protein